MLGVRVVVAVVGLLAEEMEECEDVRSEGRLSARRKRSLSGIVLGCVIERVRVDCCRQLGFCLRGTRCQSLRDVAVNS